MKEVLKCSVVEVPPLVDKRLLLYLFLAFLTEIPKSFQSKMILAIRVIVSSFSLIASMSRMSKMGVIFRGDGVGG